MSNAHASKQHGLTTMNTTRPKSLLRRRNNKHRSVARKIVIMEQRRLAAMGKTAPVKAAIKVEAPAAEKPVKAPAKKVATKTAVKKPAAPRKPRAKKIAAAS